MERSDIRREIHLDRERASCKLSCTKIDQGLEKLDPRSEERAIWELFQNARDLAKTNAVGDKEAHIKISLSPTEFVFAHQGRPFTPDSLTSLVMQVSSQEKENDDTVGQYGTGFLTTHMFGRKLCINGSLDLSKYPGGRYVNIDGFLIDRTYKDLQEFIDKVALQLLNVSNFADADQVDTCREWTELRYDLSSMEGALTNASKAISEAIDVIPFVMTINTPIVEVIIENQLTGDVYRFAKQQMPEESGLKVMHVSICHNESCDLRKIYYLESEDGEDIVILPLESPTKARSLTGVAKLFVFFPLLGTEEFGMDAIFHSKKFFPLEARDGIHLPVSNANVKAKVDHNIAILNSLIDMTHRYYQANSDAISGWLNISKLTFDCEHHKEEVTRTFFCNLKKQWTDFFEKLPMIDLGGERVSVADSDVQFFSPKITTDCEDTTCLKTVYDAAALKFSLPATEDILAWSNVIASWDPSHSSLLEVEDIAFSLDGEEDVPIDVLHSFDSYIAAKKLTSLFSTYELIPNREGCLMKATDLRNATAIPQWLGEISETLAGEQVEMFADDRFVGLVSLPLFSRNDLRSAITERLRTLRQKYLDKGKTYDETVIKALFNLSSIFASETSSNIRRKTLDLIGRHLNAAVDCKILPPLDENERDMAELPFKHLVENLLLEISQQDSEWISANYDYILDLHSDLSPWAEYYNRNNKEGLCMKYGAFPNRRGEVCSHDDLEHGQDIPDELSSLYCDVFGEDLNERLVDDRFSSFFEFNSLSSKDVAREIESELEENKFQHPSVLDIINNLSKGAYWNDWFPHIASKKAELFLKQVQPDCKESIFKLMKVTDVDKLNKLAELSNEINIDDIIKRGRASVIESKNKEADFNFKLVLGNYVERMIQKYLAESCEMTNHGITVETEHYGCDLSICKHGSPIYYIEIKSRWGKDQSVKMSPLQIQMSVDKSENYALCCVDMSHLGHSSGELHEYPSLDEVLPYIKILTNIGSLTKEISTIIEGTNDTPVYIGGDFQCIVPQHTIQANGKGLSSLITTIVSKL